jgi:protein involved in polysaccharide export with SLBB domain
MKALASAGGLTELAAKDRIFLLRSDSAAAAPVRIRFRYEALARAEGSAAKFRLRPGDTLVVE